MLTILCAGCLCLYPVISAQFTLEMCVAPTNSEKFTKTPLGVQSGSRSSMFLPPESSSAVLLMISSKSVFICKRSRARRANSGEITIYWGVYFFDAFVRGNLLTQRHEICSQEMRHPTLSPTKTRSLYLIWT